jgi:7-cyano-7-deazaguanine reductase
MLAEGGGCVWGRLGDANPRGWARQAEGNQRQVKKRKSCLLNKWQSQLETASILLPHDPAKAKRYNTSMPQPRRYTPEHAAAGLDANFPEIETWPNQFPGYEIVIDDPEFTSVCPKTGLPDFGVITLRYQPDKLCLELKSYKEYLHTYRNLGIFQENIVNRVLEDVVRWAKPVWAEVKGDFRPRGGISTTVLARWPRAKK